MSIEKITRIIRRALKQKVTYISVRDYLEDKGFSIFYIGTVDGDRELERFRLTEFRHRYAFTYVQGVKLIFVRADITENEKLFYLLHELGHYELGHLEEPGFVIDDSTAEREAETFAYLMLNPIKNTLAVPFAISLVVLSVLVSSIALGKNPETVPAFATDTARITQEGGTTQQYYTEDIVYVSSAGGKYHLKNCAYAQDAFPVYRSQAVNRYAPCSYCNPHK